MNFAEHLVVILHVRVALGRALVVIERDAGRNDVDHDRSPVRQRRLENRQHMAALQPIALPQVDHHHLVLGGIGHGAAIDGDNAAVDVGVG